MTVFCYLVFYLICALNVVVGIQKKKNNALYAIALIAIFTLMTFYYKGPDIGVYLDTYKLIGDATDLQHAFSLTYMDRGYVFLMYVANKVGLDFYGFRAILTIVCLSLFVSSIKFFKVNPNFIIGLYMVYLFFFDTIQIRNCIVQFVVLFSTRYLFKKSGLSILKYIICIAIAGSMHVLAWVFISLLLARFIKRNKSFQKVFVFAAMLFIVCVLLRPILPQILDDISKYVNRGSNYFHSTLRFNYLIVAVLHLICLLPLYWYKNKISDKNTKSKINGIMRIEIIMALFLPLCFINSNFNRIFRNTLIIDTIGLALMYEHCPKNKVVKTNLLAAQILSVGGWLVTDLIRNRQENIIDYVISYNLLYNNAGATDITQYFIVVVLCLLTVFALNVVFSNHKKHNKRVVKCSQSRC